MYGVPAVDRADLGATTDAEAVSRLVEEFDEIDIVFTRTSELGTSSSTVDAVDVAWRRDWAGGRVALVATDALLHGVALARLTVHGGGPGGPTRAEASKVALDCDAAEDVQARARLDALHDVVVERLGVVAGYATAAVGGEDYLAGEPCVCRGGEPAGAPVCGCWVSECAANNLVADALQWYVRRAANSKDGIAATRRRRRGCSVETRRTPQVRGRDRRPPRRRGVSQRGRGARGPAGRRGSQGARAQDVAVFR